MPLTIGAAVTIGTAHFCPVVMDTGLPCSLPLTNANTLCPAHALMHMVHTKINEAFGGDSDEAYIGECGCGFSTTNPDEFDTHRSAHE
jgi:hypothetical protein